MAVTSKSKDVWLLGKTITRFDSDLPSINQVLQRFLHLHKVENKTIPDACRVVSKEVLQLWSHNKLDTIKDYHVINKIKKCYAEYLNFKKRLNVHTETEMKKRNVFIDKINLLFDVGLKNMAENITDEKSYKFYLSKKQSQRQTKVVIPSVNFVKNAKLSSKKKLLQKTNSQPVKPGLMSNEREYLTSSDEESSSEVDEYVPPSKKNKCNTPRMNIQIRKYCFLL